MPQSLFFNSVKLLGADSEIIWKMTPGGLQITPPADLGVSQTALSFEVVTISEQHSPNVIEKDATKALKGPKKFDLNGER